MFKENDFKNPFNQNDFKKKGAVIGQELMQAFPTEKVTQPLTKMKILILLL